MQGERIEKERAQLKLQQEAEEAARIQAEEAEEEDAPIYRKPRTVSLHLLSLSLSLPAASSVQLDLILLPIPLAGLRLTPHTELGDNDSIKLKTPQKVESTPFPNRSNEAREKRRKERERRIREREGQ